jgi:uncharacterized protein (DUF1015 family)
MAKIIEFKGIRPKKEIVEKVAELPYDVVNSMEAKEVAKGNDLSFYNITKPEITFKDDIDPYDERVYQRGKDNLDKFIDDNILVEDDKANLYLYTLIMNGREQTGLVSSVSIDDYNKNIIRKHEFTRKDKEKDRTTHLNILNANTGPVFLLFKNDEVKEKLFSKCLEISPEYDFTTEDGVRHIIRVIDDKDMIKSLKGAFSDNILYIADGHHRAASGAKVGMLRREANPDYTGEEGFNSFLTVSFPDNQLKILAYNRAIKDLNGLSTDEFFNKVSEDFIVEKTGEKEPQEPATFSIYLDKNWYIIKPKFTPGKDPINSLDVKILQDYFLDPILGISDPRVDNRISFIGGIRGTKELEKLVDSGDYAVAVSMYPTSIKQLMDVSDANEVMPPKSTWFEPKLRSGIFIHSLD